jgi:hypothetical protein
MSGRSLGLDLPLDTRPLPTPARAPVHVACRGRALSKSLGTGAQIPGCTHTHTHMHACTHACTQACLAATPRTRASRSRSGGTTCSATAPSRWAYCCGNPTRELDAVGGDMHAPGQLWDILPDGSWAEIVSGLRPDMVAGSSGPKPKEPSRGLAVLPAQQPPRAGGRTAAGRGEAGHGPGPGRGLADRPAAMQGCRGSPCCACWSCFDYVVKGGRGWGDRKG